MIDEPVSFVVNTGPVCPWCSGPLPDAAAEHCPTCGAAMTGEQEPVIPGVTTVEPEILARQSRPVKPRRSGLMSLFVGREDEPPNIQQPTEAELPALARPSIEVRREMLRIELEAAGVLPTEEAAPGPGGTPSGVDPGAPAAEEPSAPEEQSATEEPQGQ